MEKNQHNYNTFRQGSRLFTTSKLSLKRLGRHITRWPKPNRQGYKIEETMAAKKLVKLTHVEWMYDMTTRVDL